MCYGLKCWRRSDLNIPTIPLLHLVGWMIHHSWQLVSQQLWRLVFENKWGEHNRSILHISLIKKTSSSSKFLEAKWFNTSMTKAKIGIFAGWALVLVVQSVQSSKSHAQCHFYLGGKIAFSIKVKDRLLTEPWLRLQSPWDDSTDPPTLSCILLNHPPTHKPTHLRTHALALT